MRFATLAAAALSLPFATRAAPIRRQLEPTDALVLKFAQVLEQLETEFYKQALAKFNDDDFVAAGFTAPDVPKQLFQSILGHETSHTDFLTSALAAASDAALDTCTFNFDAVLTDVPTMAAVARVVEQVGVAAYLGGAGLVTDKSILLAAGSILTIESRHQSALNVLNGGSSVPQAFDLPLSPSQVLALAGPFISGCDLGIPANLPVTVTNTPAPGAKLEFDLTGIENAVACQMVVAGLPFSLSQPIDNCIVPTDLPDGPVFVFITDEDHPLASTLVVTDPPSVKAGPAIVFIDQQADALSDLVRQVEDARDIVGGGGGGNGNAAPEIDTSNGSNSDVKVIAIVQIPA